MVRFSVVVPTKNEEANIATCLEGLSAPIVSGKLPADAIEVIVVDNSSTDRTREIAAAHGAKVLVQGPERCAQRNRGWREAKGEYVLFVDADMILPAATIVEAYERTALVSATALSSAQSGAASLVAYYIPELRVGRGLRLAARNFERSFYNASEIDGLRLIPRSLLEATGGYDEKLVACEDWDLDRRLKAAGAVTACLTGHLLHNETRQNLRRFLAKKAYYSTSVAAYRAKWSDDATCRRQFGLYYRYFGVFVEHGKWKRLFAHPVLTAVMYFERFAVGVVYLLNR